MIVFSLLFLAAAIQDFAIPISTPSEAGWPVALYGTAIPVTKTTSGMSFESFETRISVTNVSDKDILLMVLVVHGTGLMDADVTSISATDYFFESDVFSPHQT